MSQLSFSPDWLRQFSDPYAVLGIAVTADERRVLTRYRAIAKLLHPDGCLNASANDAETASQIFARLVNPAYQQLKQEKGRLEVLALLRIKARRLAKEEPIAPEGEFARRLMAVPLSELELFYAQATTQLAENQYAGLSKFPSVTTQLGELNLVYLQRKAGEFLIREKKMGVVPAPQPNQREELKRAEVREKPTVNYADRHFQRAQEYFRKANWPSAIRELQEAIKLDPNRSAYHALLGQTYWMHNLPGMARVHIRQALKLDAKNPLALEYAKKMQLPLDPPAPVTQPKAASGGFFGLFARRR